MRSKKESQYKEISEREWESLFQKYLDDDRVEVPEDYYDEDILYDDTEQLMDIYSFLEEQNLKRIRESQDVED